MVAQTAAMVRDHPHPRSSEWLMLLYKYTRPFLAPHFLRSRTIAFAPVGQLNDPFESSIESALTAIRADYRPVPPKARSPGRIVRIAGVVVDALNPEYDRHISAHLTNSEIERHNQALREKENLLEWSRENVGVLSLTADPLNVVMWAHYAELGRGLCLGFDMDNPFFSSPRPADRLGRVAVRRVVYQDERPAHTDASSVHYVQAAFHTKYTAWLYEQEYRLLADTRTLERSGPAPVMQFPPECLRAVILGMNADPEVVALAEEAKADFPGLHVARVAAVRNEYRLQALPDLPTDGH